LGRLVLKPTPLGIVSEGIGERYGLAVKIPGRGGPVEPFGRTNANSFLLAFRSLDLAHIIGLLLTLMALLFTYDAVSGERESGMLRLTLTNSLPRYQVVLGEYVGALLGLIIPLLGCFLFWLLLVRVGSGIGFSSEEWVRLLLIFLFSVLLVSVFAMLGIMISSLTHRGPTSVVLCTFLWIALSTLYPDLSSWITTRVAPIPSRASSEFTPLPTEYARFFSKAEIREMMKLPPEQQEAKAKEVKRQFQEQGMQAVARVESEKDIEFRQMESQATLAQVFQTLSPITAYLQMASILSTTDLGTYVRFRTEARRLNSQLAQWQEEKMQKSPRPAAAFQASLDLSDLPQLSARQEPLREGLYRAIPSALALVIFHFLAFVLAVAAFNRYDAR
jgi:ABC-type transport system involved in multi-copper enzyme maturation permease subunit